MAVTNLILTLCSTRSEALTTFSSFSAEVVTMRQPGRFVLAEGTASLHLFGSLALTVLGLKPWVYFGRDDRARGGFAAVAVIGSYVLTDYRRPEAVITVNLFLKAFLPNLRMLSQQRSALS
jgi:hypothetical protein